MAKPYSLKFAAEVHQVNSRKLASLDREFKIVFITDDPSVLNLGAIAPDILVDAEVKTHEVVHA